MEAKKPIVLQRWLGSKHGKEGSLDRKIRQRAGRLRPVQMPPQPGREKDSPGTSLWDCGPRVLTHPLFCSSQSESGQSLVLVFRREVSLGTSPLRLFFRLVPNLVHCGESHIGSNILLDIYFKMLLPPVQCQISTHKT